MYEMKRVITAPAKKKNRKIRKMIYGCIGLVFLLILSLYQKCMEKPYDLDPLEVGTSMNKEYITKVIKNCLNDRLWYDEDDWVKIMYNKDLTYMVCCDQNTLTTDNVKVEVVFYVDNQYIILSLITSSTGYLTTEADFIQIADKSQLNARWKDRNMKIMYYGELDWKQLEFPIYDKIYLNKDTEYSEMKYYLIGYANQFRLDQTEIADDEEFTIDIKNSNLYHKTIEASILYHNNYMLRLQITKKSGEVKLISSVDLSKNSRKVKSAKAWLKKIQETSYLETSTDNLLVNTKADESTIYSDVGEDVMNESETITNVLWNINGELFYGRSEYLTEEYIGQSIPYTILHEPVSGQIEFVMQLKEHNVAVSIRKVSGWGDVLTYLFEYVPDTQLTYYMIGKGFITIPEVSTPVYDKLPIKEELCRQIEQTIHSDVGKLGHDVTIYIGDANPYIDDYSQITTYGFSVYIYYEETSCVVCSYNYSISNDEITLNKPGSTVYSLYTDSPNDVKMKTELGNILINISDFTQYYSTDWFVNNELEPEDVLVSTNTFSYSDNALFFERMKETSLTSFTIEADLTADDEVVQ